MDLRRAILASVVIALIPTVAFAHAAYKDSDPKDEATVSSPPSSVWAEYTEPVQEGYLHIYDPCGIQVDDGNTEVMGYRMTVGMSADRAGTYAVQWKAASAVDPHVTSGTFTFTVTDGQACPGEEQEEPAPEERDAQEGRDDSQGSRNSSGETVANEGSTARTGRVGVGPKRDGAEVKGTRQSRARAGRSGADDEQQIELVQSAPSDTERGIWEGIPIGGFLLALAIAAAIGAAGGRIYANIMGPRR